MRFIVFINTLKDLSTNDLYFFNFCHYKYHAVASYAHWCY